MKQFYVYVQCKPDGEPFYVGKGHGERAWSLKPRNLHYERIVSKHCNDGIIVHIYNCESERHAFECERWMIAYGRSNCWNLSNVQDGGQGGTNKSRLGQKQSAIERSRKSSSIKAAWQRPSTRANHRASLLGNKNALGKNWNLSQETRARQSEARRLFWANKREQAAQLQADRKAA
jgi:hypothetical protein